MRNQIEVLASKLKISKSMLLFFVLVAIVAIGNGLSDSIYGNYFKDAYDVSATQRAFIEFPRELPGILCVLVIGALSFLGDIRIALLAQIASCIGVSVLGIFSPSFSVMLLFLFINSLGMHIFMPLQDSIGMSLAKKEELGKRVGQFASIKTAMGFLTSTLVFVGFRFGWFSFTSDIKWTFIIASFCFMLAAFLCFLLYKETKGKQTIRVRKTPFVFRHVYRYFYLLTILHGVQKQIAYVFGSWVLIDLLLKGADIMSLLLIVSSFMGIFFMQKLGLWIDRFGVKKMMYVDALSFIIIYVVYGFVVWGITTKYLPSAGWPVLIVYGLFVLDRLSMQMGIVKSVYLKKIAKDGNDVTAVLSTGISLDHVVSIIAAQVSGYIWVSFGPQWVFFMAAFFSLGNLYVASRIQ